jgi:hypothetical protein
MSMSSSTLRRRFAAAVSAVAMATLAAFLGMGTAQAASAHPAPAVPAQSVKTITVTRPMRVVGIDAAVAKAHGYTVRTDAQGKQYVAKLGSAAVTPQNTVAGPCGNSWVTYTAIGGKAASLGTGYVLNPDYGLPVSGFWEVAVVDDAGTGYVENSNPVTGSFYWDDNYTTYHSVTGYSYAEVVSDNSYVITDEGWLCYSAAPSANTTLY